MDDLDPDLDAGVFFFILNRFAEYKLCTSCAVLYVACRIIRTASFSFPSISFGVAVNAEAGMTIHSQS